MSAHARHTLLRLLFAAALLGLLQACSTIRIGYSQADVILAWMADDYFDFDHAQKQDFNARIDRLLKWHREEQLPDYARFLGDIRKRGQRALTREDAEWMVDGAKERFRVIARHGARDAADMLSALTPDNIRALERQFEKMNQKFVREYKLNSSMENRKRARLDRTLKQLREWAGPLTPAQEERITTLNAAIPSIDHLRHADRQRRQKEFLALLNQRHTAAELAPRLQTWLTNWDKGRAPEYDKAQQEVYEQRVTLYLEAERMLTPQQREHALRKLQHYIDDINALAARRVAESK